MNKEYILKKIDPYLDNKRMLMEKDFEKLFAILNKQQQYEIINILIESDIEINYGNTAEHQYIEKVENQCVDISKLENISNEQLCVIYQQGNKQALEALINNNIKFIWSRVKKYSKVYKHKLEEEDLVQYGIIGMMKAAERFEVNKDTKFVTYAIYWIDQAILRSIVDYGYTVRIPVHYFEEVNKAHRILRENPTATKEEIINIAASKNINKEKLDSILFIMENILSMTSLNILVGADEDSEIIDFKIDEKALTVEEEVEYSNLKEMIVLVLETLPEREREVIELRFGLKDGMERTLEQVGEVFGVTRERIRQIEGKAIRKLRHPTRSKKIRDFIKG